MSVITYLAHSPCCGSCPRCELLWDREPGQTLESLAQAPVPGEKNERYEVCLFMTPRQLDYCKSVLLLQMLASYAHVVSNLYPCKVLNYTNDIH